MIGTDIKRLREKLNITQRELAKRINVSYQAISRYELGQSEPNPQTRLKLYQLFIKYL